ncbi:MAG: hypothetical protein CNLJKLNK_01090 [Holosporales bacterium]
MRRLRTFFLLWLLGINGVFGDCIDAILVEKSKRLMTVFSKQKAIKQYKIALGFNPVGHKEQEGDGKTPQGTYRVAAKNDKSQFHKSLRVSYPNGKDSAHAKKRSVSPGGDIMIHGLGKQFAHMGKNHHQSDWTLGCIAVTNEEIDEIFNNIKTGTTIKIVP